MKPTKYDFRSTLFVSEQTSHQVLSFLLRKGCRLLGDCIVGRVRALRVHEGGLIECLLSKEAKSWSYVEMWLLGEGSPHTFARVRFRRDKGHVGDAPEFYMVEHSPFNKREKIVGPHPTPGNQENHEMNTTGKNRYLMEGAGSIIINPLSMRVRAPRTREWSFRTTHPAGIDFEALREELTPEAPLMFVESGRGDEGNYVLVHSSIMNKSVAVHLVDLAPPFGNPILPRGRTLIVELEKRRHFSHWKDWVKRVRSARWPDDTALRNHTYKVKLLEV